MRDPPVDQRPAVITVGDELLMGEAPNGNQAWMLATLAGQGMPAALALSLPDEVAAIGRWVAELRAAHYRPLFVSGGLGGTHDDHTREGIAVGLGRALRRHEECFRLLADKYGERFNEQRQRMAWLPEGARLVDNPIGAPGFAVDGVYAFPGFPTMLQPMLRSVIAELCAVDAAAPWTTRDAVLPVAEGDVAADVEAFARANPHARVGIYPSAQRFGRELTLRIRCPPGRTDTLEAFERLVAALSRGSQADR